MHAVLEMFGAARICLLLAMCEVGSAVSLASTCLGWHGPLNPIAQHALAS